MKLLIKISFLLLVTVNLFGGFIATKQGACNSTDKVFAGQTDLNVAQAPDDNNGPARTFIAALFHHGIDESNVFESGNSKERNYSATNPFLSELSFLQSWHGYFYLSYNTLPGYQVHLCSLPLRSPPIRC